MALIPMREMLFHAKQHAYALGYFEAWDQYSLEGVLQAAESERSPVVLGFGGMMMDRQWFDERGLAGLAAMGRAVAETARVPVCYLLNEVPDIRHVRDGLNWGFNAVMLDTAGMPLEENIAAVKQVAEMAHAVGADAEGECGDLPDASHGGISWGSATRVEDAVRYVAETDVDALSVSVGNVHVLAEGAACIDMDLLKRLCDAVRVPLVLHGGTGLDAGMIRAATAMGVAKVNVGTSLKAAYVRAARQAANALPERFDIQAVVGSRKPTDFLVAAREAVCKDVAQRMRELGSSNQA